MPSATEPGPPSASDPIALFVSDEAAKGSWPGAVYHVEERGRTLASGAVGQRALVPDRAPAQADTVYDLASLTKPLATAALAALLAQEGRLDPDAPAEDFLPGLACAADGRPTLLDLVVHRSGLPAWRPFYALASGREEILDRAVHLAPEAPAGAAVVYSDPGYILLGEILVRIAGKPLDELFQEKLAAPLRLETVCFRPSADLRRRVAPTEMGNRHEEKLAKPYVDRIDPARFRQTLIAGEVHDGNAWALGGVAGHAGLFGAASEVGRLAREFLGAQAGGIGLFSSASLARFRENLTPGLSEGRTFGWKRAVAGAREAQGVLPPDAFGHTGFTGTSVWMDPVAGRIYVLLTNRVHPEVGAIDMNRLRRRFHEIASRIG